MPTLFTNAILPIIGQSGALAALRSPDWLPDFLGPWLFESHWVYSIGLLVAAVLLYFFAPGTWAKIAKRLAAVLGVVALLWMVLPMCFITPGERLRAAHEQILQAASTGQSEPIKELLAADFRFGPRDREMMVRDTIDIALRTLKPKTNLERFYAAKLRRPQADTQINILTTLETGGAGGVMPPGPYLTKWKLHWRDEPGKDWQLVAITHWYTSDGTNDTEMPFDIPLPH